MIEQASKKRVTLKTIADEVGVAHCTVSAVLNDRTVERRVSNETRKQILEVARRLNYQPNYLARGLRGRGTKTVGVLWSLGGPHPSESMARRIAGVVQKHGYVSYLVDHLNSREVCMQALDDFVQRGVEAVVLQDYTALLSDDKLVSKLMQFGSAVVVRARKLDCPLLSIIHHDRTAAFAQVAEHFVKTNRKRPAFLLRPCDDYKWEAFSGRLLAGGISPEHMLRIDLERTRLGPDTMSDDTWQTLRDRFTEDIPFDALQCNNDECATAAIAYLRSKGLRVPEDVAVVGFNDNPASAYQLPPLASISRRDMEVAGEIERMLFERLTHPDKPAQKVHVPMEFVCRASAMTSSTDIKYGVRHREIQE